MPTTPTYHFTADTHFGHANIIRYSLRPFSSPDQHDATLIANWNRHVAPHDIVYHLGDFAFGKKPFAENIRAKLNGSIYLIEGNHDAPARQIRNAFQHFTQVYEATCSLPHLGEIRLFLSHYAHRVWNRSHHGIWHLYGHTHNSLPDDPNSLSMDVGVDAVAALLSNKPTGQAHPNLPPEHYRPLSLSEIAQVMSRKTFKPLQPHTPPNPK